MNAFWGVPIGLIGSPNITCTANWSICFFSPFFHLSQLSKFFSFLQVKYPSASSSGVIISELRVLILSFIFLVGISSPEMSKFAYYSVLFNDDTALMLLILRMLFKVIWGWSKSYLQGKIEPHSTKVTPHLDSMIKNKWVRTTYVLVQCNFFFFQQHQCATSFAF